MSSKSDRHLLGTSKHCRHEPITRSSYKSIPASSIILSRTNDARRVTMAGTRGNGRDPGGGTPVQLSWLRLQDEAPRGPSPGIGVLSHSSLRNSSFRSPDPNRFTRSACTCRTRYSCWNAGVRERAILTPQHLLCDRYRIVRNRESHSRITGGGGRRTSDPEPARESTIDHGHDDSIWKCQLLRSDRRCSAGVTAA